MTSQFRVVGYAGDGLSLVRQVRQVRPNLLIVDVNIPGGGLDVLRDVTRVSPETYILVYSSGSPEPLMRAMFAAGADQYLAKTGHLRPLLNALYAALPPQVG